MFCCFFKERAKTNKSISDKKIDNTLVFKFLNAQTYELDVSKLQLFVFDKHLKCIHTSYNNIVSNILSSEEFFRTNAQLLPYKKVINLALDGIETKKTVMENNTLMYFEGKTLYYNEDKNDIYACMLLFLPYKIVPIRDSIPRQSFETRYSDDVAYNLHNSDETNETFAMRKEILSLYARKNM